MTTLNTTVNPYKFPCDDNDVLAEVSTGQCFSSALINITAIRILGIAVYTAIHTTTNR